MKFFDVETSLNISIPVITGLTLLYLNSERSLTLFEMGTALLGPILLKPSVDLTLSAVSHCTNNRYRN